MYEIARYVRQNTHGDRALPRAARRCSDRVQPRSSSLRRCRSTARASTMRRARPRRTRRRARRRSSSRGTGSSRARSAARELTSGRHPRDQAADPDVDLRDHQARPRGAVRSSSARPTASPRSRSRFFNVYGPGQALSNPYTGVAAIFSSRLLNDEAAARLRGRLQSRDFIHVDDIVRGSCSRLTADDGVRPGVNLGTGRSSTHQRRRQALSRGPRRGDRARVTGQYRAGDVRHCFADTSSWREQLPRLPGE